MQLKIAIIGTDSSLMHQRSAMSFSFILDTG